MEVSTNNTDINLWQALQAGDESAYAQIYELYVESIYDYGIYLGFNKEEVEDAIHDVFIRIYSNRKKLANVENIKLYLLISLKNTLLNIQSKQTLFPVITDILEEVEVACEEDRIIENEHRKSKEKIVQDIFNNLTPRQQEILTYRFYNDLSYKEISTKMDISVQSAKNMMQVIIKKLRNSLVYFQHVLIPILFLFEVI